MDCGLASYSDGICWIERSASKKLGQLTLVFNPVKLWTYIQSELNRVGRKESQFSVPKVIRYILHLNHYQREVLKQFAVKAAGRGSCTGQQVGSGFQCSSSSSALSPLCLRFDPAAPRTRDLPRVSDGLRFAYRGAEPVSRAAFTVLCISVRLSCTSD